VTWGNWVMNTYMIFTFHQILWGRWKQGGWVNSAARMGTVGYCTFERPNKRMYLVSCKSAILLSRPSGTKLSIYIESVATSVKVQCKYLRGGTEERQEKSSGPRMDPGIYRLHFEWKYWVQKKNLEPADPSLAEFKPETSWVSHITDRNLSFYLNTETWKRMDALWKTSMHCLP
jgi:hypothetical protein